MAIACYPLIVATAEKISSGNAIYSSIINHGLDRNAEIVVIAEKTTGGASQIGPTDDIEKITTALGIDLNTYVDWGKRNREKVDFSSILKLDVPYVLLTEGKRRAIFDQTDIKAAWVTFSDYHNGAKNLLRFSQIGYNYDITSALVYVEHLCGPECSSGRFVALKLVGTQWVVKGSNLIWVAY